MIRNSRPKWARFACGALCALVLYPAVKAHADIGVALADPTTIGVSEWTHAGHSLVYLSGVCAASPVRARLCAPGEQGSIVTMYPNFYEAQPYSWNIVPLSLYLEGSATPGDRLLYASHRVKQALEVHARTRFLAPVCPGASCQQQPHSYWRDLVGATIDRDIFFYVVRSTRAQDQAAVDYLNGAPNVNQYRTLTHNCSDFTRGLVDAIFPHSVHRDFLNDLAMMSPKAAAHSFTRWAVKRPELGFYTMHFAQQPGDMPRSGLARSGTEDGFHMKKYLIPAALIGDHEVAGSFFVAYYCTGRFGLYKEYALHPDASIVADEADAEAAKREGDTAQYTTLIGATQRARLEVLGDKAEWAAYRQQFAAILASPEAHALTVEEAAEGPGSLDPGAKEPKVKAAGGKVLFPAWFAGGTVTVDSAGHPWLAPSESLRARKVGLSSANVLAPQSDPELAFALLLGRVSYVLLAKDHFRESLPEFQKDWALLQQAQALLRSPTLPSRAVAANEPAAGAAPVASPSHP